MVRWLYRRRTMLDSFVMRAWRRWYRRWGYRLRVLGSFPTLWRGLCQVCGFRRWQAGNDEWYVLCMGCLDGYSRAALLEWGPGRGPNDAGRETIPPSTRKTENMTNRSPRPIKPPPATAKRGATPEAVAKALLRPTRPPKPPKRTT